MADWHMGADNLDLLTKALAALPQGLALYRADGTLLFCNNRLAGILGCPAGSLGSDDDYFSLLGHRFGTGKGTGLGGGDGYDLTSTQTQTLTFATIDGWQIACQHSALGQECFLHSFDPAGLRRPASASGAGPGEFHVDMDSSPLQGVLIHIKNRIVYANERLAQLTGYSDEDLIGRDVSEFVYPDDLERTNGLQGQQQPLRFEFRALRRDGSPLWLEAYSHDITWNGLAARQIAVVSIEERKRAEQTLKESEKRLRDFAVAGSDWFWETDAEHRFTMFSENMQLTTGRSPDSIIGMDRRQLCSGTLRPGELEEHLHHLDAQQPFKDFTYSMADSNGEESWIKVSGVPVHDECGVFLGYRGIASNVTQEIQYRATLQRDQERLLSAIDNAPTGIALYDADDRLVFANKAYRRLDPGNYDRIVPGLEFEDLLRMRLATGELKNAVGNEEEWLRERMAQHRNPGPPTTMHLKDDSWWLVAERRLEGGGTVVLITNTTAQKRAELGQLASEKRFRDLIDGSVQGIIIHCDGTIVYANETALGMRGYSGDELIGTYVFDLVAPEERPRLIEHYKRRQAGQPVPQVIEYDGLCKDGRRLRFELVGRDIEWEGRPATQATEIDITDRHLSQEALRDAKDQAEQANRVKSQFLANMSHELRTPLNAIVGFSDMIGQELLGPIPEQRYVGYARDINASGQHLLAIINDILDLSRIEVGQADLDETEVDLREAVAACLRLIAPRAEQSGLTLKFALPEALPHLRADDRRLKQIVINLLSNAVKFTPTGGTISIEASLPSDGGLRLSVTDSGIGMAPDDVERAQQPFVQLDTSLSRKFEGTGLGLALCRMLAEMHQARLEIESTLNIGTTVSLLLPPERVLR